MSDRRYNGGIVVWPSVGPEPDPEFSRAVEALVSATGRGEGSTVDIYVSGEAIVPLRSGLEARFELSGRILLYYEGDHNWATVINLS